MGTWRLATRPSKNYDGRSQVAPGGASKRSRRRTPSWAGLASAAALVLPGTMAVVLAESPSVATAATSGATVSCTNAAPAIGPLRSSVTLPAGSSGSVLIGTAPNASKGKYVGTCNLVGTVPTGWTMTYGGFAELSATSGSGNAGTFIWDTDDSTFADAGTFFNSGTFVDSSDGFTQAIAVGRFVNTGTVRSSSTGFATNGPANAGCSMCKFVNWGTVDVNAKDVFSSGGTFVLEHGGTIDATGNFSIANLSTFDVDGGSVTSGVLSTGQFLGRGPATIAFASKLPAASAGTIDVSTGVNLTGVIAKHWVIENSGGSITATSSGNAGTFEWTAGIDDSTFSDNGTFVNSGTFTDDATGFTQAIQVLRFVNSGTLVSNAPGLGTDVAAHTNPVFADSGVVEVGPKAVFNAAGTFELATGGSIVNHGTFNIASTTLDVEGGSALGEPLSNPYHLGESPTTLEFASPPAPSSRGTVDIEIQTGLDGVVPSHWALDVGAGPVTATPGSGNDGTLNWEAGVGLTLAAAFVNHGTLNDPSSNLSVTGSLTNDGSLELGATARASFSANFDQGSGGSLAIAVAGPSSFATVTAGGQAVLGGALAVDKLASYHPQAGDALQLLTAHQVSGTFHDVSGTAPGPGLTSSVSYSAGAVTLKVEKA
jgi:hypothetical protein